MEINPGLGGEVEKRRAYPPSCNTEADRFGVEFDAVSPNRIHDYRHIVRCHFSGISQWIPGRDPYQAKF